MPEGEKRISYYQKNPTTCPVCGSSFYKEEMLTGGGRLIAKSITDELRRIYVPSKKVSEIYPLIYPVTVCPECLYGTYHEDFNLIVKSYIDIAYSQRVKRKHDIGLIFPVIDFKKPRNLMSGAASYILAISSYSFMDTEVAPTFKKGLSSLRAAWVFDDLDKKYPGQNYDKIKMLFYKKAARYYELTVQYAQTGEERIDNVKNYGPDLDKNYGFEGVLYISSLLLFKYGINKNDPDIKNKLTNAKRIISKVFGSGKSSKSKPSLILDLSKDLYEKINERLEELNA